MLYNLGCNCYSTPEELEQLKVNDMIEKEIRAEKSAHQADVKM